MLSPVSEAERTTEATPAATEAATVETRSYSPLGSKPVGNLGHRIPRVLRGEPPGCSGLSLAAHRLYVLCVLCALCALRSLCAVQ